MRRWNSRINALGLACAGWLLAGAPAFAQSTSSSFGGGGSSSSGGLSFGSSSSGGLSFGGSSSGGSLGGSSSGSSFGFGTGSTSGSSGFGGTSTTGSSNTSSVPGRSGSSANVGATSFMGAYYGNPLAGGLNINQTSIGAPLYNLTGTAQTRTTTTRSATNQAPGYYGAPLGLRRLPAYAVTLRIKDMPPPQTPLEVRADLQNMLAQSGQLDSRDAVRVLMDGQGVVLQGEVADEDERRLVENMVLLTPGVKAIRNELAARNPTP